MRIITCILALALTGCALMYQRIDAFNEAGAKVCEAHIVGAVLGSGETTQTSGACAPYATTTKDTGFSDNAVVLIPDLVKKAIEGAAAASGAGAAGTAAGVILDGVAK